MNGGDFILLCGVFFYLIFGIALWWSGRDPFKEVRFLVDADIMEACRKREKNGNV